MTEPWLLEARNLGWSVRGRRLVGPVDLRIRAGECLAVVGPNGAGKTSLLRLVMGLLRPTEGSILWRGEPLAGLPRREVARRIAYVPQLRPASIALKVEQFVLLGRYPHLARLRIAPEARDFEVVAEALELVGIAHLRNRPMDELSGGERQAAFIGAALAQEAELLVLDEPTTHLDPRHQRDVGELVRRLGRAAGKAVLTATHELNFASLVADRVLALKDGLVLTEDTPEHVLCPEVLERLFGASFELVRGGARPVTVLDLGRASS